MINYSNGKIYKIVCDTTGLIYVGSTTKKFLSSRLVAHRSAYKLWKNGKRTYITSFKVLENDNFKIVLVEAVKCNTKDELSARERYHIESTDCVNKTIPNRTIKEWIEVNKESISKKAKERYQNNKEHIAEQQKEYKQTNRDLINKKARETYAKKKREYMELYPLLFPK